MLTGSVTLVTHILKSELRFVVLISGRRYIVLTIQNLFTLLPAVRSLSTMFRGKCFPQEAGSTTTFAKGVVFAIAVLFATGTVFAKRCCLRQVI